MLNAVVAELSIHKLKKRTHRFSVTPSFAPKRSSDRKSESQKVPFTREYLFSWRHLEIDSVLLLRLLALSALTMKSFSIQLRPWVASFLFLFQAFANLQYTESGNVNKIENSLHS